MIAKWSAPIRKYWKVSEQMMVKYCDLAICDSVNIEKYIHECYDGKGIKGRNPKTTFIAYYRKKIMKWGTTWFACSKAAAKWIFPEELIERNNVKVVYNGIDINRFKYDEKKRVTMRKSLGLKDEFVLIHTGRFIDQKNQGFVLDIFKEIKKQYLCAKLIFLGTGNLLEEIEDKAQKLGLQNDVLFLGVKPNVEDYLCAADCYVMPSLYEGLPVAAIEAQCSGLPSVMSTNITNEVVLTDNIG